MRISDWSSDVCSSDRDLAGNRLFHQFAPAMGFEAVFLMRRTGDDGQAGGAQALEQAGRGMRLRAGLGDAGLGELGAEIGQATGRERGCTYEYSRMAVHALQTT